MRRAQARFLLPSKSDIHPHPPPLSFNRRYATFPSCLDLLFKELRYSTALHMPWRVS
eukprot:CAMPEP_0206553814 /NCGR_PEP_ID=MMETSP0325_2-20121206/16836_1 /ASSEMBLY_ACC=CAM_ASM_000347 /TAXON_ID=2866 /ORGANISM="Crypthecodinium cohnii, Strain Seligo" /LENGTH=56 /DNA_ID=CAMNT_0054053823 /DNA_START=364 /DNA_END=530 /DNA_ORIENTATION=-